MLKFSVIMCAYKADGIWNSHFCVLFQIQHNLQYFITAQRWFQPWGDKRCKETCVQERRNCSVTGNLLERANTVSIFKAMHCHVCSILGLAMRGVTTKLPPLITSASLIILLITLYQFHLLGQLHQCKAPAGRTGIFVLLPPKHEWCWGKKKRSMVSLFQ